ncbi:MAG TPA: prepilin-type N-terminal cleavage/methylation domain-containing protein [Nocardioides sp.]|nr:prepilin-type N-terminal cleavage/methylation domain-containing protein [Nocardioides sp.]
MLHALQNQRRRSADAGFTLIELLIVIVILGILAAIVVFSVQGITDRGKVAACKADVETVTTAVEAFYAKTGAYPTAASDLWTAPNQFIHGTALPADVTYSGGATVTGVGC